MTRRLVLGVDVGGSNTRAAVADDTGLCLGASRHGPGNPTSVGPEASLRAIRGATGDVLAQAGVRPGDLAAVVFAMSGETALVADQLQADFADAAECRMPGDVLAMFASGTHRPDGGVVLAGTGSIAARVAGRDVVRVVGGKGWLLGDQGSGFATGHAVARAVIADLDGLGSPTILTSRVLQENGIDVAMPAGEALATLGHRLRSQAPVRLARLAPLAVAAAQDATPDPVAADIIALSRNAIAELVAALALEVNEPLVVGGSFLVSGLLPHPPATPDRLSTLLAGRQLLTAPDGLVGAVVLAMDAARVPVTATVHSRLVETTLA